METPQIKRGAEVARRLGWPAGGRGIFGAVGHFFDPDLLRFQVPLSYRHVLEDQRAAYNQQLRQALNLGARKALEEKTRSRVG